MHRAIKDLIVWKKPAASRNQIMESVALFNDDGSPVTFGLKPGHVYGANVGILATTAEFGTFDLGEYLGDSGGWYDPEEGELVLPPGPYNFNIYSYGTISVTLDSELCALLKLGDTTVPIPMAIPSDVCTIGFNQVVYLTEETRVVLHWCRNNTTVANIELGFIVTAL